MLLFVTGSGRGAPRPPQRRTIFIEDGQVPGTSRGRGPTEAATQTLGSFGCKLDSVDA